MWWALFSFCPLQNESELFGRTIRVNLAKPMRIKEGSSRPGELVPWQGEIPRDVQSLVHQPFCFPNTLPPIQALGQPEQHPDHQKYPRSLGQMCCWLCFQLPSRSLTEHMKCMHTCRAGHHYQNVWSHPKHAGGPGCAQQCLHGVFGSEKPSGLPYLEELLARSLISSCVGVLAHCPGWLCQLHAPVPWLRSRCCQSHTKP